MKPLRVMIVEDDAIIAMLLEDILQGMGHTVCATVATESDAVAASERCELDLMIVDATLRSGTGAGAVATILSKGFLRCVQMSGSEHGVGTLARDAVFVQKPFTDAELARAIDDAMATGAAA